jgi:hypothetical protein
MKVAHGPEVQNWSRADRISGVTGLARFLSAWELEFLLADTNTCCLSKKGSDFDRDLNNSVHSCTCEREKEREIGEWNLDSARADLSSLEQHRRTPSTNWLTINALATPHKSLSRWAHCL